MDLILRHKNSDEFGIFGTLEDQTGDIIAVTLEHAYPTASGYSGKIPPGVYTCVRGWHRLHSMVFEFETFEITGIAGHSNILFHWGNYNKDSDGCVLLGAARVGNMVTSSRLTFVKFITLEADVQSFILTVS